MKLIFERGTEGQGCTAVPDTPLPEGLIPEEMKRNTKLNLPHVTENELMRHYTALSSGAHGINCGFYPLGSCTMKYNPKIGERLANLPGFTQVHPLQPEDTVKGCRKVMELTEKFLCEITGMDAFTLQPAAGAHGEFTGLLLIRHYLESRGETERTRILVPDSAHGTNPASAAMAGFEVVHVPSGPDGCLDLDALKSAADEHTAGLMLTNPNTVGLFDPNILKITAIVHEAGGLCYYDGANLNAIMGVARPGDMGFDVMHVNLHKTFATPHGGGGPGSGPVGCRDFLTPFLKEVHMRSFQGNFLVAVKALTYMMMLGRDGIPEAAGDAVLAANYLKEGLKDVCPPSFDHTCMHEFVISLEALKKETGVTALDVAKAMLDYGVHPPTMYFPLIVHEALMFEPTETESKETLDDMIRIMKEILKKAHEDPEAVKRSPVTTPITRPDEVTAARKPVLRYRF